MKKEPSIKIFVSNRIDLESEQIKNNIYIPVRCGAVFDERKNISILGDNTGDNISDQRMSFCELTVLYWAWKNQKADYYGLCHYRRYLSFNDKIKNFAQTEHDLNCVMVDNFEADEIKKLADETFLRSEIEPYDAIFMEPIDLKKLNIASNYEAMKNSPDYHNIADVNLMMEVIKCKYPEMYQTAYEYMYLSKHSFLYNCFVMKADIFNNFCEWLFDILFTLDAQIDKTTYTQQQYRALGTIGERLVGIYELYLRKQKNKKIRYTPLLFVKDTSGSENLKPAFNKNNIPIVSNFNDNYSYVFSAFLSSLIDNSSKENNYDLIVLSDDITETHKNMLTEMLSDKDNMSIRFVSAKKYLDGIDLFVKHNCYSIDLYYRIIIPQILTNYDKIIVVDADMICMEDIANLYSQDVTDYLAGAVKDSVYQGWLNGAVPTTKDYAMSYMCMENPYLYVNTGTLLFNGKKYRETYSLDFLKKFICKHISSVRIYEQDMLNMLLYARVKFLDEKWNCYTKSNDFIKKCFSLCPYEQFVKWNVARNSNLGIIHYAAAPKPWQDSSVDLSPIWWKYARKTPFYEEILSKLINFNRPQNVTVETDYRIIYAMEHPIRILFKKISYKVKKQIGSQAHRAKYKEKYNRVKSMLKEAKKVKKSVRRI